MSIDLLKIFHICFPTLYQPCVQRLGNGNSIDISKKAYEYTGEIHSWTKA